MSHELDINQTIINYRESAKSGIHALVTSARDFFAEGSENLPKDQKRIVFDRARRLVLGWSVPEIEYNPNTKGINNLIDCINTIGRDYNVPASEETELAIQNLGLNGVEEQNIRTLSWNLAKTALEQ